MQEYRFPLVSQRIGAAALNKAIRSVLDQPMIRASCEYGERSIGLPFSFPVDVSVRVLVCTCNQKSTSGATPRALSDSCFETRSLTSTWGSCIS